MNHKTTQTIGSITYIRTSETPPVTRTEQIVAVHQAYQAYLMRHAIDEIVHFIAGSTHRAHSEATKQGIARAKLHQRQGTVPGPDLQQMNTYNTIHSSLEKSTINEARGTTTP